MVLCWWLEVLCCDAVMLVVHVPNASLQDLKPILRICLSPMCSSINRASHPLPSYNQYISCIHLEPYKPLHNCTKEFKHLELIQEMYQYTVLHSWKERPPDSPNDLWKIIFLDHVLEFVPLFLLYLFVSTSDFTGTRTWWPKFVLLLRCSWQNSNIKSKIPYQVTIFPFTRPLNPQEYVNVILKRKKHKSKSIILCCNSIEWTNSRQECGDRVTSLARKTDRRRKWTYHQ